MEKMTRKNDETRKRKKIQQHKNICAAKKIDSRPLSFSFVVALLFSTALNPTF
jgi:hypothetical protein